MTLKDVSIKSDKDAALKVEGDGNVRLELDGKNELKSGANHAGVEKNNSDSKGTLTIKDDTGEKGSLTATGGAQGAGIGGAKNNSGSNIEITGGTITATGGCNNNEAGNGGAAGIGGGFNGSGTDIKITGGNVTANGSRKPDGTSGCQGAGIGGGYGKGGTNISISGEDTVVNANGGKYGEISNDDLLSKDFTGILTRKDNTGKVMEDYSKDATPLPASEENGVVWVDADVSGWGGVRIAVPEGTPTDSVSACYLEEGALLIVDAGGSDCLLEGRVSDLRQNGIRQLCLRWNGGEQTLSTDALAAAGGEDASFRLTEVNGGLTMVLNGLTRNELLAK